MSSGPVKQKYNSFAVIIIIMCGGNGIGLHAKEKHPNCEARWQQHFVEVIGCRRDWCTPQNTEGGIMTKEYFVLHWSIIQAFAWLQSCGKNSLRTTKWSGHHKALTSSQLKICDQGGLKTWLSYSSSFGPKSEQLIVRNLWMATWNVWPKLNNLKAMLLNTNLVYVNF